MQRVPLRQIFLSFTRVGAVLFGGGYAMLPLLEREVVTRRQWCPVEEMADYYAMAQLVPGVVAINTSILIGHRLRGFWGALAATLGGILIPFGVILIYALAFEKLREFQPMLQAMAGLRPAVAGMMLGVAWNMFRRSRQTRLGLSVVLSVVGLTLLGGVPTVVVILLGVALGLAWWGVDTRKVK